MIENTNIIPRTKYIEASSITEYQKIHLEDIKRTTEILDYEFERRGENVSVDWILKVAEALNYYQLLTGEKYVKKIKENTII
jgi:hypothetical protein